MIDIIVAIYVIYIWDYYICVRKSGVGFRFLTHLLCFFGDGTIPTIFVCFYYMFEVIVDSGRKATPHQATVGDD